MPDPPRGPSLLAAIGIPNRMSAIAVAAIGAFVAGSVLSIDVTGAALIASKDLVVAWFDGFFVVVATGCVVAVAVLAVAPGANVRLGPDDEPPEFGRMAWFSMLFSAGLASGLLYWATAEPVIHFQGTPFLERGGLTAGTASAVVPALRLTILHWALHGWAFYVLAAIAIGIYGYRHGRPITFRTALFPVLGEKWVDRWPGRWVDFAALLGTICGVATSIGLAAAGLNATLDGLLGIGVGMGMQIGIVMIVCLLGVVSALSGVSRGIRLLSEANVWLSLALLVAFFLLGPTAELASLVVASGVGYVQHAISDGLWLGQTEAHRSWQAAWTVFYWGWWLAWTPFVAVFIARISRGRTVREFAVAVMVVPALVIIVWMAVFGGTALYQELDVPGSVSVAVNEDYSRGLVAVIQNFALGFLEKPLIAIATVLLFSWLITSLDSATLVICHLLGVDELPQAKVFWGVALGAVTSALLLVGGVPALQAASIVVGVPLAALVVLMAGGLLRDLVRQTL